MVYKLVSWLYRMRGCRRKCLDMIPCISYQNTRKHCSVPPPYCTVRAKSDGTVYAIFFMEARTVTGKSIYVVLYEECYKEDVNSFASDCTFTLAPTSSTATSYSVEITAFFFSPFFLNKDRWWFKY